MKRFTGLLNRSKTTRAQANGTSSDNNNNNNIDTDFSNAPADSPEATGPRAVRLFCESGSNSNGGEEVLHLPVIVESAECSPSAAAAAAQQIRKFLDKSWSSKPYVQYNAIMLIRILTDNPGPTFTRNFDKTFVSTIKELLRHCKDQSTQQILRETLDALEAEKAYDEGLQQLFVMWRKEKGAAASLARSDASRYQQPSMYQDQAYLFSQGRTSHRTRLPTPAELSSRVEEARNTAKILLQLVQSTPTEDVLQNGLVREFSERCQSAQRSMQSYMNCDDPAPDHDTMQTLIDTNEQLSLAMSRYQRTVLAARRAMGVSPSPVNNAEAPRQNGHGAFAAPPPQQQQHTNGFGQHQSQDETQGFQAPSGPPPSMLTGLQQPQTSPSPPSLPNLPAHQTLSDPFADPFEHDSNPAPLVSSYSTQHQRQSSSQAFQIEPEVVSPPAQRGRHQTRGSRDTFGSRGSLDPDNAYSASPPRPGLPWHTSDVTQSYVGRQASAANGVTMHGAQSDEHVQEIDGHSQVGRSGGFDRGSISQPSTAGAGSSSEYSSVSPVQVHSGRRVDIAGTGGLRSY